MTKDPIHLEDRAAQADRLFSPSAGRNSEPIGDKLDGVLSRGARILEIASGTGEHAAHMCSRRDDIIWQCSDPDATSRASQDSWAKDCPGQMLPSLEIDTTRPNWWVDLGEYEAMYCANMIHIAPWEAAVGLAKGAQALIAPKGVMCLYGPFKEGTDTAPSNLEFDENLKRRNPAWGVRDLDSVKHIFADAGFNACTRIVMPKNNRLLIFTRPA